MSFEVFFTQSPIGRAFGFHTQDNDSKKNQFAIGTHRWINLTNFLSWIPGLCLISAAYHFVLANSADKCASVMTSNQKEFYKAYASALRARAIAELLQASVFLAILDVIASVNRFCSCNPQSSTINRLKGTI